MQLPSLPGNDERTVKFTLTTFDRLGTAEKPLDRFSLVTAKMEAEEAGGIVADNSRYAVVEVREKLPILVVDGKTLNKDKKESSLKKVVRSGLPDQSLHFTDFEIFKNVKEHRLDIISYPLQRRTCIDYYKNN